MNKIAHAAERKAFQTILNRIIEKGQTEDVSELAESDEGYRRCIPQ